MAAMPVELSLFFANTKATLDIMTPKTKANGVNSGMVLIGSSLKVMFGSLVQRNCYPIYDSMV